MLKTYQVWALTAGILLAVPGMSQGQGVDDPTTVSTWTSEWDMDGDHLQTRLLELRDKGQRPIGLEVYPGEDGEQYSAVWVANPDSRAWACFRNMTAESYEKRWDEYRKQQFRPVDIEIINVDGELKFAGIWEENKEDVEWFCWWDMNEAAWAEKFKEHSEAGYRIKDVEVYPDGDEFKYAAIWVLDTEKVAWQQHNHMSYDDLDAKFLELREQNFRISDIEAYDTADGMRYAAVWVKSDTNRGWAVWWNMDADLNQEKWEEYRDDGYRPLQIVGYPTSDGLRYAAVYRDNNPPETP